MHKNSPLADCVSQSLEQYFKDLNGEQPSNLHNLFIHTVEKPFLAAVMRQAGGNQSKASEILGINRNTLRKKLQTYGLN